MGFDVLYLPPIHPIGEVNRKGPNNTLTPGPDDPGSPWAIGSKDGGHDAIHPDLGTFDDFDAFVARAGELGLEVALDLALQAAPDHPWVTDPPAVLHHARRRHHRLRREPAEEVPGHLPDQLRQRPRRHLPRGAADRQAVDLHGVRIFRVDNPHTKPLAFWEWLLAEVRRTDPDVLFLSEAFTKPAMMHGLGAVGYHQSYTYFTWRTGKREIEDYLVEVSSAVRPPDAAQLLRQHPRHPARLPAVRRPGGVQGARRPGRHRFPELGRLRRLRALRARGGQAGLARSTSTRRSSRSGSATGTKADAEGTTLAPYLTRLNEVRRAHPALQLLRNVTIHESDDDQVLVFSKRGGATTSSSSSSTSTRTAPGRP